MWGQGSSGKEAGSDKHPLEAPLEVAKESRDRLKTVTDYQASFIKREVVGGKLIAQTIDLKFREKPFSVYMRYRGAEDGREVLYVEGQNRGNLLVHDVGIRALVGTMSLAPTSREVMSENRHPITKSGMSNLLETIIAQWELEVQYGEIDVKHFKNAKLGEQPVYAIQSSHPQPRKQFKFHMTRLYFDLATMYPVRVEQYDFPKVAGGEPPLVEEYTFLNVKPNVGLTDIDFSAKNQRYRF